MGDKGKKDKNKFQQQQQQQQQQQKNPGKQNIPQKDLDKVRGGQGGLVGPGTTDPGFVRRK